jgi:hypothetical protein
LVRSTRRRIDRVGERFEFDPLAAEHLDCIDVNCVMKRESL